MDMDYLDRSNYFRGMLLLISRDKRISEDEIKMMMKIGQDLGFAKDFCKDAINNLFFNEYILQDPPKFSNKTVAEEFFKESIELAFADRSFHLSEVEWLNSIAKVNNLDENWCAQQIDNFIEHEFYLSELLIGN